MKIIKSIAGQLPDGRNVESFVLENDHDMRVGILNYGGTITQLLVPDSKNTQRDVVLGFNNWEDWIANEPYFNCIVGRTCNRIGEAKFTIDGKQYKVSDNRGGFQLHGGFEGFNKKVWKAESFEQADKIGVVLHYTSPDGEEGFPGNLSVTATYSLNNFNELSLALQAITDKATPVNLTNHFYFNLDGEGAGTIYDHVLQIYADAYTLTNKNSIPTGELAPLAGTPLDFSKPQRIGEKIDQVDRGYDNNYALWNSNGEMAKAATVFSAESLIKMEIFTTEPGIQLYTSNWFDGSLTGKCGKPHLNHTGFCLETQHFPDAMNHPEFKTVILYPGETFKSETIWRFGIHKPKQTF